MRAMIRRLICRVRGYLYEMTGNRRNEGRRFGYELMCRRCEKREWV
jgi:hypothetical protein